MRQRIIEGAIRIFIQQGIKATTMDDIAKQLGVSKRTIYEHFRDKRELLSMMIEYAHIQTKKEEADIFNNSKNVLEGLLKVMKKKKSEINVKLMKIVIELKRYYPEVIDDESRKNSDHGLGNLEERLKKGIEEGVFRADLNPKTSAFLFSEQARLFFTEQMDKMDLSSLADSDISALQVIVDLFVNLLRGISTTKGIKIIEKYMLENYGKLLDTDYKPEKDNPGK
jgi:AcrR family transcriptional regulator